MAILSIYNKNNVRIYERQISDELFQKFGQLGYAKNADRAIVVLIDMDIAQIDPEQLVEELLPAEENFVGRLKTATPISQAQVIVLPPVPTPPPAPQAAQTVIVNVTARPAGPLPRPTPPPPAPQPIQTPPAPQPQPAPVAQPQPQQQAAQQQPVQAQPQPQPVQAAQQQQPQQAAQPTAAQQAAAQQAKKILKKGLPALAIATVMLCTLCSGLAIICRISMIWLP